MKNKKKDIQALPSKRIYLSIIADYHLKTALCELVDNALDNWTVNERRAKLLIHIKLDFIRQIIEVFDNSGGVKEEDIQLIVSPGQSRNSAEDATIGIFGVGSKRAVVALAEEVKIYTRYQKKDTMLVEINDHWIKDDNDWHLTAYQVDNIAEGSTKIELTKLRNKLESDAEQDLIGHFAVTYAMFLDNKNLEIRVNKTKIEPVTFNSWSYPPGFEPKQFIGELDFGEKGKVKVKILGGLTKSGDPSGGEYGLYLYCNDRLISKAYKGSEIGYRQSRIGEPHPAASLARAIIKLTGPSQLMPWNSDKSEINTNHQTFREIIRHIDRILFHYATLSKRWSTGGGWDENIFKYKTGKIEKETLEDISSEVNIYLPPVPKISARKYADVIKKNNRELANEKPWVKGFYEAAIAVEELPKLRLEQNNRLSLLILDSMLEIAFKEYLVNDSGTYYSDTQLVDIFKARHKVQAEVRKTVKISDKHWKKINHFYRIRCELVHKKASVDISDDNLAIFRVTYEHVVRKLFKVNFKAELLLKQT